MNDCVRPHFFLVVLYTKSYNKNVLEKEIDRMNNKAKVNLSSKLLSVARKRAIKEAYIPKDIRNTGLISVSQSGEVVVRRKKQ